MSKSNRNITLRFIDCSVGSIEFSSLDSPEVDSVDPSQHFQPPVKGYVLGTCNGLCHLLKKISEYAYHHYIWNPFTRKYRELPAVSLDFQGLPSSFVWLTEIHGFAYVPETDEYKVVHVTEVRLFGIGYIGNQVYIFSSSSNNWERVEPFPYQMHPGRPLEAHLNGVLHTVTDCEQWKLMAFDTNTKHHSMLPKPDFASNIKEVTMDVLEGNLCLSHKRVINSVDIRMDIWVMKDYGVEASWIKLFSLVLDPGSDLTTNPLSMTYTEGGAEIIMADNVKKLMWYNSSGEKLREVIVNSLEFFGEVWYESLVSFPGFISVDDEKEKSQGNEKKKKKEDDVNKEGQKKRLKYKGNTSSIKGFLSQGFKLKL